MTGQLAFRLPQALEARVPPEARGLARDGVGLLVGGPEAVQEATFRELPRFLRAGDLLVLNDSATLPAALKGRLPSGEAVALHLSTHLFGAIWVVEVRGHAGERLEVSLPEGARAVLLGPYLGSRRLRRARLELPRPVLEFLAHHGRPVSYSYARGHWPLSAYQTVFARRPGSAEMPSAGRAFTLDLLTELSDAGVGIAWLTLHTGVSSPEHDEPPYPERFHIPAATHEAVARAERVIAVGTTVLRALESDDSSGWTDLVVRPDTELRVVDCLLSGFHEPRASHLAMIEAVAGRGRLERDYAYAVEHGFLWHEFGDLHLVEGKSVRRRK